MTSTYYHRHSFWDVKNQTLSLSASSFFLCFSASLLSLFLFHLSSLGGSSLSTTAVSSTASSNVPSGNKPLVERYFASSPVRGNPSKINPVDLYLIKTTVFWFRAFESPLTSIYIMQIIPKTESFQIVRSLCSKIRK